MGILEEIIAHKREEIARRKPSTGERGGESRGFRAALAAATGTALIAEVKKASPSKGVIVQDFDPVRIANAYAEGGANCLSVLTEERYFQGSLDDLKRVRDSVSLPILRKDFVIDESQVMESLGAGADCILLIVAALDKLHLRDLFECARESGLDVLVETHDEREMETAAWLGADMVGVNNRDLRTFDTDIKTTERLAKYAPKDALLVSESAIWTNEDVRFVSECGAKAVLVGESLEREASIADAVRRLMGTEDVG